MTHVILESDIHDERIRPLLGQPVLTDWLAALGVDPDRCRAFRVLVDGTVQVTSYRVGEDGKFLVSQDGDRLLTEVDTVPLSVPIPEPLKALCDVEVGNTDSAQFLPGGPVLPPGRAVLAPGEQLIQVTPPTDRNIDLPNGTDQ